MRRVSYTFKAWLVITAATLLICFLTEQAAKLVGITLADQQNLELVRKAAGWNWRFVLVVAQIVVVMPVVEEFIFRYLLFRLPSKKWAAVGVGCVSAALFSAAHYLQAPFPDNAFLALFFFGLAQCWLYQKTARIWCAMLNHALFNATNLILLFAIPPTT